MPPIYLDHAATTPLHPIARAAMDPYLCDDFGNPSSGHRYGRRARMAVDEARERVAEHLGARPADVVFTSGGTESINCALLGVAFASQDRGRHIVTTAIEHHAVLETCDYLATRHGFSVTYVPVGSDGVVIPQVVRDAVQPDTVLVSVMYVNNEIGTIQPVRAVGESCRALGVPFHVDAVQAVGAIDVDVMRDGIDLLSLSAHKFYGPKGAGALITSPRVRWWPLLHGGGQERDRRSGTENVAGIVGLAAALNVAVESMDDNAARSAVLRDRLLDGIMSNVPRVALNGCRHRRLPGNANLSFDGVGGESAVMALDAEGVLVSSGSACASGSFEPSHVLHALGCSDDRARSAVRFTVGMDNSAVQIDLAVARVTSVIRRLRAVGSSCSPPHVSSRLAP